MFLFGILSFVLFFLTPIYVDNTLNGKINLFLDDVFKNKNKRKFNKNEKLK